MLNLRMLKDRLLIRLDDDTKEIGGILLPDLDMIKYCERCGGMGGVLDGPCQPEDIFEYDRTGYKLNYRGQDFSHQITYATQLRCTDGLRAATVLQSAARGLERGARVIVSASCGAALPDDEPLSPFRVIHIDAVQGLVEDEDEAAVSHAS